MNSGMFEMAIDREGLEDFNVDPPATAAKESDKQRRYGSEIEIGGVEAGLLPRHRDLAFDEMAVFFPDSDIAPDCTADRFDNAYHPIGDGPVDLRQLPPLKLPVRLGRNADRRYLHKPVGLAQ